jgi:hypothetical protein
VTSSTLFDEVTVSINAPSGFAPEIHLLSSYSLDSSAGDLARAGAMCAVTGHGAGSSPRVVTTGGNPFPSKQTEEFCPAYGQDPLEVDCRTCHFRHRPCCFLGGEAA